MAFVSVSMTRTPVGAARVRIADHAVHDRERAQRQPARRGGGRQRRAVAREVGAVRTAAVAAVARLARAPAVVRLAEHGAAAGDQDPVAEHLRQPRLEVRLDAVHLERRQQLSVGELRQAGVLAADADEALDHVVPRRDVRVADRPVDADAFPRVGREVEVAPAEAVPGPQQRSAADVIAAEPLERLDLVVGVLDVLDQEVLRVLAVEIQLALDRRVGDVLRGGAVAVRQLPRREVGGGVVLDVFDRASALEDERAQAAFGQHLRGPPAADAGADDDRVVGVTGLRARRHRSAQVRWPGARSMQPR